MVRSKGESGRHPMVAPVEFKFKIDAYSPATMPMARLARYLQDLSVLLGETKNVHLVRLEEGSTVPVFAVDWEAVPKVKKRANDARTNDGPQEVREAKLAIEKRLAEDNAPGGELLDSRGARILHFAGIRRTVQPEYGPFSQTGTVDGIPIVIGGENDPVPVHLRDRAAIHNCVAPISIAKRLGPLIFTQPVRATGVGRWFRAADGVWELRRFVIENFIELRKESLSDAVARVQAIDAKWKLRDDAINELISFRDTE